MLARNFLRSMNAYAPVFSDVREFPFGIYSGFTPNQVIHDCRPTDALVYAVVQHLAFYGNKITPKAIIAKSTLPERTINNALTRLKGAGLIEKTSTDWLFLHHPSNQMVSASQLTQNNLGYYVRLHDIKDPSLNAQEVLSLSIMYNLVSRSPQMDIGYIAKIFRKSDKQTRLTLSNLCTKGYLLRRREHQRCPYRYEIVPAAIRKRLTTQGTTTMEELSQPKANPPHHDLSNPPHYDRSILSINCINKFNNHLTNEEIGTSHEAQPNSFLKKEIQEKLVPFTEKTLKALAPQKEATYQKMQAMEKEYTEALSRRTQELRENKCISKETSIKINELYVELGKLDVKKKKIEHFINVWKPYTNNIYAAIQERRVPLTEPEILMLKGIVRVTLGKIEDEEKYQLAYCLLFNSLVKDIQQLYSTGYERMWKKSTEKAKANAIKDAIAALRRSDYEFNVCVYPHSKKRINNDNDEQIMVG